MKMQITFNLYNLKSLNYLKLVNKNKNKNKICCNTCINVKFYNFIDKILSFI